MNGSSKKNYIIAMCLVCLFSLFFGYYISFRVNQKDKTKLEIIREIMENEWYYGIDEDDISTTLETKMILGMQDLEKDPYTKYLLSLGSLADSYRGIGVTINKYGEYYIISEVSSRVSVEAGIQVNDILVYVNGISVKGKTSEEIKEIIASSGNSVRIGVVRDNLEISDENITYIETLVSQYNPITVFTKEYNDHIAYVKISEFNMDTAASIKNYFATIGNRYNDLVIDLRDNPGGYIESVRQVMDLFVTKNKVVMSTIDKNNNVTFIKTSDDIAYIFDEIYVLINGNSASGAEALAAAMDYHLNNVVLYGDTTYGKGSAQKTYYFEDGTYFHYTYALWRTPFNKTINHVGVKEEISDVNAGIGSLSLYDGEFELYDYGEHIKVIQEFLKKSGNYSGEVHGFVDEATIEAIKSFQTSQGLVVSGEYDDATIGVMAKMIYDDNYMFQKEQLDRVLALFD
jgi:carboxyl-terminal processing protease